MKIFMPHEISVPLRSAFEQAGIEINAADFPGDSPKDPKNISLLVLTNPHKQIVCMMGYSNLPSFVFLPYGEWKPSFLQSLAGSKMHFITVQDPVRKYLEMFGATVDLVPLWFGERAPVLDVPPLEKRDWDILFIGKPHTSWLKVINSSHDFKILFNTLSETDKLSTSKIAILAGDDPGIPPWVFEAIRRGTVVLMPHSYSCVLPENVFPAYNPETIAETLRELLSNPDSLQEWAACALEWFKQKITPEQQINNLLLLKKVEKNGANNKTCLNDEYKAMLYAELGEWQEAGILLEKTALKSEDPVLLNNLAVCRGLQKDPEAENIFKSAGTKMALLNLGCYYFYNKQLDSAMAAFKESLAKDGRFEGWVFPGGVEGDATSDLLNMLLPGTPQWETALLAKLHELMTILYLHQNKQKEAINALKEAHKLLPDNAQFLFKLGGLYLTSKMVAQPIKYWNEALKLDPFNFDVQYQFANIYTQLEMNNQAIALLKQGLKFPSSINLFRGKMWTLLGYNLYQIGNYRETISSFEKAIREEPEDSSLKNQLAVAHVKFAIDQMQRNEVKEARANLDKALEIEPDLPIAYNTLGSIAYRDGDLEKAKEAFQKAIDADPNLTAAKDNLNECLLAEKVMASLIIVSHHEEWQAKRCLEGISQFSDLPYEILYIYPYGEAPWTFLKDVPNLRLVQANYEGLAMGYNVGLSYARGRYMVFMEDDVIVGPNWLSCLICPMEDGTDIGATGPCTNFCSNPEQITTSFKDGDGIEIKEDNDIKIVEQLDSFCIAVKRENVVRIGGWDPSFILKGLEDLDFCLRLKCIGRNIALVTSVFVNHAGLVPFSKSKYDVEQMDQKNNTYFKEKWSRLKSEVPSLV